MIGKKRKRKSLTPDAYPTLKMKKPKLSVAAIENEFLETIQRQEIEIERLKSELSKNGFSNDSMVIKPDIQEYEENTSDNPWEVSDATVFLKYCCPECDYK